MAAAAKWQYPENKESKLCFLLNCGARFKLIGESSLREREEHLAEGRSKGGQARREQMGTEGYQEMGRKGGLSTMEKSGQERVEEEGIPIDESKYKTKS